MKHKFKVGDRVKSNWYEIEGIGKIIRIDDEDTRQTYCVAFNDTNLWHSEQDLTLAVKTFDEPQIGDEYKDSDGYSLFVLGVAGRGILISGTNNKYITGKWCTKEQLISWGYTIVQDELEVEQVEELTMEQVCKELGREVKIKK